MEKKDYKFINESENQFTDISAEAYRTYYWSKDEWLFIENPMRLHVSDSEGHRVASLNGQQYYVKPGWKYIVWGVDDKKAHFSV